MHKNGSNYIAENYKDLYTLISLNHMQIDLLARNSTNVDSLKSFHFITTSFNLKICYFISFFYFVQDPLLSL